MDQERISPSVLFHSFMIVAGSYMASLIFLFILFGVTSRFFFPETFEFLSDPDLSPEQLQGNADLVMPQSLFWVLLVGQTLFSFVLGWLVTRISRYAKFNHAIFVAVVLFVSFLQTAIKNSGEIQWKLLTMMCFVPIAVLIGAKIQGGKRNDQSDVS